MTLLSGIILTIWVSGFHGRASSPLSRKPLKEQGNFFRPLKTALRRFVSNYGLKPVA
ncbi:MAG: hypothetical protein RMK89_06880 [Armatimonadota bacterium]|nr:hypothetical protein [Armatimonadota bacterium]MDW8143168.1 hypothetical protein [Armatimonadota bacterium]